MAMNPRPVPQVYNEFEPRTEWAREPKWDTLVVHLPGFKAEKLKVQVTSDGKLRVSGEQHLVENRWRRFLIDFLIPSNCDTNRITAKYEGGVLYVRQPNTIVPAEPREESKPQTAPTAEPDQKPAIEAQQKKNNQEYSKLDNAMVSEKSAEKEKEQSDVKSGSPENGNKNSGEEVSQENTEKHERAEKCENGNRDFAQKGRIYQKIAGDLVMKLKQPRNLVNLVFVVLLALILFLYNTKKTNSIGDSQD